MSHHQKEEKGHQEEREEHQEKGKGEGKDDCGCHHEPSVVAFKSNPHLSQLLELLSQPITDDEKERILMERRSETIHLKLDHGIAAGAPPRSYYGHVKQVASLTEAEFASEFGVDFDAFIAEGERNNQIPLNARSTIDRKATLAAMHRFATHGWDGPIEWNPEPVVIAPRALTPCQDAIVGFGIEAVVFVLNAIGLKAAFSVGRQILNKVPVSQLTGLSSTVKTFSNASGGWAKAAAAVDLVLGIFSLTGLNTIVNILWSSVSWWQWLIMGAWIVIQLFAWFASAGLSTIAYLAGVVLGLLTLINAGYNAINKCYLN